MEYRRIGESGLVVSEIGLGSWLTYGSSVDNETALQCIRAALEVGVIFFDTADIYSRGRAEEVLGTSFSGVRRQDLVIATKAYFPMSANPNDRGLSRKHLFESIHQSLRRLGTDYVDLYQCHRFDPNSPVAETVRAMDDLARQGKILYWGVSHWSAPQIQEALRCADALGAQRPISHQPPYNMLDRRIEEEILPFCKKEGIGQLVFSPLAEGILTGKYSRGIPRDSRGADERTGEFIRPHLVPQTLQRVERVSHIAAEAGMSVARLALAWTLRDAGVSSAIVGASRPEQVRENATASGVQLSPDILHKIELALAS